MFYSFSTSHPCRNSVFPSTTPFAAPKSPGLCHKAARSSPVCCFTPSSRHLTPALSFTRRVLPALPGGQRGRGPKICGIKACLLLNYTAVCPETPAQNENPSTGSVFTHRGETQPLAPKPSAPFPLLHTSSRTCTRKSYIYRTEGGTGTWDTQAEGQQG